RSNDGGKTWQAMEGKFAYEGEPGTHKWYDGSSRPFEFKRIWHLEPSLTDPDTVYAGAEDAALFRSTDGGQTWGELPALRQHSTAPNWAPGAGGMCLHTIILDPKRKDRMFVAISAAGAFRSDDAGKSWQPINQGLRSEGRGRPLRASNRDEPLAPRHPLHAEALGRHAHRRCGRYVARGEREPSLGLRVPDRHPPARARDHLRGPDQERLRTHSAGWQTACLSQPHGR